MPVAVPALASGGKAVTAGAEHTCALTTGGVVWCWGSNTFGQLGTGSRTDSRRPVQITELGSGVREIAAGRRGTCALTGSGTVRCWGASALAEAGDNTYPRSLLPADVSGLSAGARAVTVGGIRLSNATYDFACAVDASHGAVCWGSNQYGFLGDGTRTSRLLPGAVARIDGPVRAIDCGDEHCGALDAKGRMWCWGSNGSGRLGRDAVSVGEFPQTVGGFWSALPAPSRAGCSCLRRPGNCQSIRRGDNLG